MVLYALERDDTEQRSDYGSMWGTSPDSISEDRWYTVEAVQSIFDYFDNGGRGNPLVAMPTGSGKTHVIARFIKRVMQQWPSQRFLVTTHVKELIEQNADKFGKIWPYAPFGVHSAGLKSRDYMQPIIFGGIQSMANNPELFGHRDLMFIDEAHLVSPGEGTRYQTFIAALRARNPKLKVIGLSATIYRTGIGYIHSKHEGQIFTDVCYDLTTMENFARLISEGYLARLSAKKTNVEIDVSSVSLSNNGDFNQKQLQEAADREKITHAALQEACQRGYDRRSWLAFASGIEHSEHVAEMLRSFGISAVAVHNKTSSEDRKKAIEAHKNGSLRCLVGNNIFTTGYDHPPLDMIIDLQPTMSVAKHVQKYGRGMRPSPETGKADCLVLDFGGNIRRCGPVNDPYVPKRKDKTGGDAPVKICEACGEYNHAAARVCEACGEPFEFITKIVKKPGEDEPLRSDIPVIETFPVDRVFYTKNISRKTGIPYLQCAYFVGLQRFEENVFLENEGFAGKRARDWWRARHWIEPPPTVDEALKYINELRVPAAIKVWVNRERPEIHKVEWASYA